MLLAQMRARYAAAMAVVPRPPMNLPRCPSGAFCMAQPARVAADAGAPAPYGMCEASPHVPADAGVYNPQYVYTRFDDVSTKKARDQSQRTCCYTWVLPCPGGRAHRGDSGEPLLAPVVPSTEWLDASLLEALALTKDVALADRWTREAQFEHASIAAFAQVTLDLLALAAPSFLVEAAQRAGLDEVRHAQIAFSLASAHAGRSLGPGAFPRGEDRPIATLERLVRETIADGCIGEAAAALALREEAARAPSAALRALLEGMASDEERHAELAYLTVAWALVEDASLEQVVKEELSRVQTDAARARVVEIVARPCLG